MSVKLERGLQSKVLIALLGAIIAAMVFSAAMAQWVVTRSSNNPDGSGAAPPGTPQFAGALDGYAARPPWRVAGVDYAVGPRFTPTTDPLTLVGQSGFVFDIPGQRLGISGSNITLSGYDLSQWIVAVYGSNDMITDCLMGRFITFGEDFDNNPHTAINFTLQYSNVFFDRMTTTVFANMRLFGGGTETIQYNIFRGAWGETAQIAVNFAPLIYKFRYNVIQDNARGPPIDGSHGDLSQGFGGDWTNATIDVSYNMDIATLPGLAGQGYSFEDHSIRLVTSANVSNNTFINKAPPSTTAGSLATVILLQEFNMQHIVVKNNYLDPTIWNGNYGAGWGPWTGHSDEAGPYTPDITNTGNVNMVTGGETGAFGQAFNNDVH